MISCGRGRSRGKAKEIEVPLRRPGGIGANASCENNQSIYNDIIEGIDNLAINESISVDQVADIVYRVETTKDEETLKSMFDKLYKHALEDKIFGIKLAKLFSYRAFFTIEINENQTMRYLLLHTLQNDYTRREEIRKESDILFRNVASLLGEIYYQMILIPGKPLRVLELPLLDYWNMLIETATEEDIELVATQVIINGKSMYKRRQAELDNFMLNVRKTLVNNTLSVSAKGMLLLIIDLANQQFNSLPTNLYDYYTSHLGATVLIYLQRQVKDLANAENNDDVTNIISMKQKNNGVNQKPKVSDTSIVQPAQEDIPATENSESKSSTVVNANKKNFTLENTVPRAIRGPGASNAEKNSKNHTKSFTNSMPPKQTRNKAWGHDDRVENDYE